MNQSKNKGNTKYIFEYKRMLDREGNYFDGENPYRSTHYRFSTLSSLGKVEYIKNIYDSSEYGEISQRAENERKKAIFQFRNEHRDCEVVVIKVKEERLSIKECEKYIETYNKDDKYLEKFLPLSNENTLEKECETSMNAFGYERMPDPVDSMATIAFYNQETNEILQGDGYDWVNEFVDDVYRLVDNYWIEDIDNRLNGNYSVIDYGLFDDKVVETAVRNYDSLMTAREISLFYMMQSREGEFPSWQEVYNRIFERGHEARLEYAKGIEEYINSHNNVMAKEFKKMGNNIIRDLNIYDTSKIIEDIKSYGYEPKKKLVSNIEQFNSQMKKNCSIKEINQIYKEHKEIPEDARKSLDMIVNECKNQEMRQIELQPEPCD